MLVRIKTNPIGPLTVLDGFPAAKLAVVEGLNGIGKTLAVRLLEICTGEMPYRPGSAAWRSLCAGLGPFTVAVRELHEVSEIIWRADSRNWPHEPDVGPTTEWFESIIVDGAAATLERVRSILSVHRLAGDEGILETLAGRAETDAGRVRRWARRHTDASSSALADLERAADEVCHLLSDWTAHRLNDLQSSVGLAETEVASSAAALDEALKIAQRVSEAMELNRRVRQHLEQAPSVQQELEHVDARIRELTARRRDLDSQIKKAVIAAPVQKELANARRTVGNNRKKLEDALRRSSTLAAKVGVDADDEAVAAFISDVEARILDMEAEQIALDAAPAMRNLLDQVAARLGTAEQEGLSAQVAIEDPETDLQLTVEESRSGMLVRRRLLEGQPPPPQAQQLAAALQSARAELEQLQALEGLLEMVARHERLVATNEERVRNALGQLPHDGASTARALEDRRSDVDDELLSLAGTRAGLVERMGGPDARDRESLEAELGSLLRELGVERNELSDLRTLVEEQVPAARARSEASQTSLKELRREVSRAEAEINRAFAAIHKREDLAWLRRALAPDILAPPAESPEGKLEVLDAVRTHMDEVLDRLGDLRRQFAAVERALTGVARRLRGLDPEAVEYVGQVENWLGERFSEWFNNERVRRELLPRAEGDVVVELSTREVMWTEGGKDRTRPLEAFSSGEQAFAYTRARLGVLDDDEHRPPNRLIILDEFGAFIAHDRLAKLLEYLRERAAEHMEDQVVVVLPLARDYVGLQEGAMKREAQTFADRASQVESRGYVIRELV